MQKNKQMQNTKKTMKKKKFQESMKAAAMPSRSDVPSQYVTSAMCQCVLKWYQTKKCNKLKGKDSV